MKKANTRKLLAVVMTLAMALSMLPISASATSRYGDSADQEAIDGYTGGLEQLVTDLGGAEYAALSSESGTPKITIKQTNTGLTTDTVVIYQSVILEVLEDAALTVDWLVIDGKLNNGATLTLQGAGKIEQNNNSTHAAIQIQNGGTAIINDSITIVGHPGAGNTMGAVQVGTSGTTPTDGNLIVNGGTIENSNLAGIMPSGIASTVTINGGTIKGTHYGIGTNALKSGAGVTITIHGGDIEATDSSDGCGIYLPKGAVTEFDGGKVTGAVGIVLRGGSLAMSEGATVESTGTGTASVGDSSNPAVPVAGIVADYVDNSSYGASSVSITGGTVEGTASVVYTEKGEDKTAEFGSGKATDIEISGGKFGAAVDPAYLNEDLLFEAQNKDGMYSYHESIGEAREAASEGDGAETPQIAIIDGGTTGTPFEADKYTIALAYDTNAVSGTPTVNASGNPVTDPFVAEKGQVISISATPEMNYAIDKITVTNSKGEPVNVTSDGGFATFQMPADDVTVKITCKPSVEDGDITWSYSKDDGKAFGKITFTGLRPGVNYAVQLGKEAPVTGSNGNTTYPGTHVIVDLGTAAGNANDCIVVLDGDYGDVRLYMYTTDLDAQPIEGNDLYLVPVSKAD